MCLVKWCVLCAAHGHQLLSRFPISFHLLSFSSYILFILKINDFLSPILGNSWYQKLIFAHRNECIINMVNLNWMTNKGLLNLSSRLYNYSPFARFSVSLCNIFYCIRVFFFVKFFNWFERTKKMNANTYIGMNLAFVSFPLFRGIIQKTCDSGPFCWVCICVWGHFSLHHASKCNWRYIYLMYVSNKASYFVWHVDVWSTTGETRWSTPTITTTMHLE